MDMLELKVSLNLTRTHLDVIKTNTSLCDSDILKSEDVREQIILLALVLLSRHW